MPTQQHNNNYNEEVFTWKQSRHIIELRTRN